MLIAALALTASIHASVAVEIDLSALFRRAKTTTEAQGVTCGIKTVGYRFVGKPGQQFHYAGDRYEIPQEGSVELIADRGPASYKIAGKSVAVADAPLDQFGFREVALPTTAP